MVIDACKIHFGVAAAFDAPQMLQTALKLRSTRSGVPADIDLDFEGFVSGLKVFDTWRALTNKSSNLSSANKPPVEVPTISVSTFSSRFLKLAEIAVLRAELF